MARASFGVLSMLRGARRTGLRFTRGVSVVLALRLLSLGPPAVAEDPPAPGPAQPETLEQVWARSRSVGYQDAATCTSAAILHGCPEPVKPDPSLAPRWQQCIAEYNEGYRLGEKDPRRDDYIQGARRQGQEDAKKCPPVRTATPTSPYCQVEWNRAYSEGYGLPGQRCREQQQEQARQNQPPAAPNPEELKDAIADTTAAASKPAASASIEPPKPEAAAPVEQTSGAKAATRSGGPSLPLIVLGATAAGTGAYLLGKSLAAAAQASKSCSTWGSSHCSSSSDARQDSSGYCHCCLQVCSGSCHCMGCGSGCSGSSLMCVNGTCVFRIGEKP